MPDTVITDGSHTYKLSDPISTLYPDSLKGLDDKYIYCGSTLTFAQKGFIPNYDNQISNQDSAYLPFSTTKNESGYFTSISLDYSKSYDVDGYYRTTLIQVSRPWDLRGLFLNKKGSLANIKFVTELNPNDVYLDITANKGSENILGSTVNFYSNCSSSVKFKDSNSVLPGVVPAIYHYINEDEVMLSIGQIFNGKTSYGTCQCVLWQGTRQDNGDDLLITSAFNMDYYYDYGYGYYPYTEADGEKLRERDGATSLLFDTKIDGIKLIYTSDYSLNGYNRLRTVFTSKEAFLLECAQAGLYFKVEGVMYKPIINGGVVVGYTENLDEKSDIDEWTSNSGHGIPGTKPVKPGGDTDDDEVKAMDYGNGSALGGFATYYLVTERDLRIISQEIAAHSPAGYSFEKNIASLYGLCNNGAKFLNVGSEREIILSGGSDPATVETGVTAPQVAGQKSVIPIGGLSLPRPHNNFLDYEPYTEVEIFVPLCGWTKIPAYCLGHNVSVQYLVDATTCSVKGIVSCDGITVAEMQGVFGSSVPFTSIQSGLKNGAQIQSLIGAVTNVGLMGVGIAMENPLLIAGGASGLISNVTQTAVTAQSNYVSTVGSMGDKTAFGNGVQCQYKITTPLEDIPSDYGARIGFVVNKAMKITAGMGFTVLSDPLINASCTDSEREELRELLQKGVIF